MQVCESGTTGRPQRQRQRKREKNSDSFRGLTVEQLHCRINEYSRIKLDYRLFYTDAFCIIIMSMYMKK